MNKKLLLAVKNLIENDSWEYEVKEVNYYYDNQRLLTLKITTTNLVGDAKYTC